MNNENVQSNLYPQAASIKVAASNEESQSNDQMAETQDDTANVVEKEHSLVSNTSNVLEKEHSLVSNTCNVLEKEYSLVSNASNVLEKEHSLVSNTSNVLEKEHSLVSNEDEASCGLTMQGSDHGTPKCPSPYGETSIAALEDALSQLHDESAAAEAAQEVDRGPPFRCDHCSATFTDRLLLAAHERRHGGDKPLPCIHCGRVLFLPLELQRHLRTHESRLPRQQSAGRPRRQCVRTAASTAEDLVTCGGCEEEFDEEEMREQHVGYHWCGMCQRVFGLLCQLKRHPCVGRRRRTVARPDRFSPEPPIRHRGRQTPVKPRSGKRASTDQSDTFDMASPPKKRGRQRKQPSPAKKTTESEDEHEDSCGREDVYTMVDTVLDTTAEELSDDDYEPVMAKELKDPETGMFQCLVCSAMYSNGPNLRRHVIAKHTDTKFECEECKMQFSRMDSLTDHTVAKHKQKKTIPCPMCSRKFTQARIVEYHVNRTHMKQLDKQLRMRLPTVRKDGDGDEPVENPIKLEGDDLPGTYEIQMKQEDDSDAGMADADSSTLIKMEKAAVKRDDKLHCGHCDRSFVSSLCLNAHLISVHGEPGPRYQCEECPLSYIRADQLTQHSIQVHDQKRIHQCPKCSHAFTQQTLLNVHLAYHDRRPKTYRKRGFRCDKCNGKFHTEEERNAHVCKEVDLERQDRSRKEMCDVCGRTLASAQSLRRHKLQHEDDRPAVCEVCGAKFIDDVSLKIHLETHRPDEPHVCHICGKGFRARSYLYRHVKFHSDNRPHVCEYCGKAFKANNALFHHRKIHTGEKPYVCEVCTRPFRQSQQLKTHMKIHEPGRTVPPRGQGIWSSATAGEGEIRTVTIGMQVLAAE